MNTQHTPGPWIVRSDNAHIRINSEDIGTVCEIWSGNPGSKAFTQDMANARLISAAPKLLAALENILNTRCFRNDLAAEHHAALDQCRAAIAKAKGEQ